MLVWRDECVGDWCVWVRELMRWRMMISISMRGDGGVELIEQASPYHTTPQNTIHTHLKHIIIHVLHKENMVLTMSYTHRDQWQMHFSIRQNNGSKYIETCLHIEHRLMQGRHSNDRAWLYMCLWCLECMDTGCCYFHKNRLSLSFSRHHT